jgi:hypothetical protein
MLSVKTSFALNLPSVLVGVCANVIKNLSQSVTLPRVLVQGKLEKRRQAADRMRSSFRAAFLQGYDTLPTSRLTTPLPMQLVQHCSVQQGTDKHACTSLYTQTQA